jgi:hypothetical protein
MKLQGCKYIFSMRNELMPHVSVNGFVRVFDERDQSTDFVATHNGGSRMIQYPKVPCQISLEGEARAGYPQRGI